MIIPPKIGVSIMRKLPSSRRSITSQNRRWSNACSSTFTQRGPDVVAHQSAKARFEHRSTTPIQRGQRQVSAHRCARVSMAGHDIIDQADHIEIVQNRPHRGHVTGTLALAAYRLPALVAGQLGHHSPASAQILLRNDTRLAVDTGGLHQVVVGLLPAALTHHRRHIWVIQAPMMKVQHRGTSQACRS